MSSMHIFLRHATQATVLTAVLIPWCARAADAGGARPSPQVRRGEHIARQICAVCHIVAADQEYPPLLEEPTPTFKRIANRPDISDKQLRQFVTKTHWDLKTVPMTMPNPELSPADTTDVIRYILSLKGP